MTKRSCVSIHIGQAGVQTGRECWDLYTKEHGICDDGKILEHSDWIGRECFHTFFTETERGAYMPKAVFVDSEPSVIDEVRAGHHKDLFHPDYMISGYEDYANNFGRGYCSRESLVLADTVLEAVRKISEDCDGLQGFIVYHSLGGGTGSALPAHLLHMLGKTYARKSRLQLSVYPAPQIASSVVEPYNTVLTTHYNMDECDCSFLVDNEAISDICSHSLHVDQPNYRHLNQIIGQVVSSFTASLRFQGSLNVDLADFQNNLVPFPRIHFPLVSYGPIVSPRCVQHEKLSVSDITLACLYPTNRMVKCDPTTGKYIACGLLYRGDVLPQEVNRAIANLKLNRRVHFVDWCPTGFKVGINGKPPVMTPDSELAPVHRALCMVSNTTAIKQAWHRINTKYDLMFHKNAFLHWFVREGLEFDDFVEARENMAALERDYTEVEKEYHEHQVDKDRHSEAASNWGEEYQYTNFKDQ